MPLIVKSNWARLLLILLTLFALGGCATALTAPVNSYCAIAKPISYDTKQDTPETVAEVELHNSVFTCLCEQDCPKGK